MSRFTTWRDSDIEVRARIVPRYMWTTASIDVFLDGKPILRTGGQASALGGCRARFRHQRETHKADLSWGKSANGAFPFILRIDGDVVLVSEVPVENWKVVVAGWLAVLIVAFCLVIAACLGWAIFLH